MENIKTQEDNVPALKKFTFERQPYQMKDYNKYFKGKTGENDHFNSPGPSQ